jgi:hypothetical protein
MSIFTEFIFTIISFLSGQIKILVTGQHISSVICIVLLIVFLVKCRKNHNTTTTIFIVRSWEKCQKASIFSYTKNYSLFDIKTNHKRIIYCQGLDGHHFNADLACNCTTLDSVSYALHSYCPPLIYKILIFCVRQ